MIYKNTTTGIFKERPNRFIAKVLINDKIETVHVKNTGRCKELLLPSSKVILEKSDNPNRKTQYDLIGVWKDNLGWVNIDSQAPNVVAKEWLLTQDFTYIKPEYTYGDSRIDFYMEKGDEKYLMEVKGCTLEIDGKGFFPDAPTERGVKHLRELTAAVERGFHCVICFVIAMEKVYEVYPNEETHPQFKVAMDEAKRAGVEVWLLPCRVTEDTLVVDHVIRG